MKNLSLASKFKAMAYINNALLLIVVGILFSSIGINWIVVAIAVASLVYGLFSINGIDQLLSPLKKISDVADEVSAGHFDMRVTHIEHEDEIGSLSWKINDMLDQLEAYFRKLKHPSPMQVKDSSSVKRILKVCMAPLYHHLTISIHLLMQCRRHNSSY